MNVKNRTFQNIHLKNCLSSGNFSNRWYNKVKYDWALMKAHILFEHCTWFCPKCEFFNFSDSFFGEQVTLETENRFVPLTKEKKDRSSPCGLK